MKWFFLLHFNAVACFCCNITCKRVILLRSVFCCLADLHLVPEKEELKITKVDECGKRVEFTYKSEPVKDIITESEFEKMTNLIGPRPVLKLPTVVNNNNNNVYFLYCAV